MLETNKRQTASAAKALLGATLVSLGIMAASARPAAAVPVFWGLSDVTGSRQGSSYTGSFFYDATTNTFSNVNITSTGAGLDFGGVSDLTYTTADVVSSSSSATQLLLRRNVGFNSATSRSVYRTLRLFFELPGLVSSSDLDILTALSTNSTELRQELRPSGSYQNVAQNEIQSGQVVPEPLTMLGSLAAVGGIGAGALKRKQIQKKEAEASIC